VVLNASAPCSAAAALTRFIVSPMTTFPPLPAAVSEPAMAPFPAKPPRAEPPRLATAKVAWHQPLSPHDASVPPMVLRAWLPSPFAIRLAYHPEVPGSQSS
jgi:hypothetical protein